ncbi:MAG: hypothetical protein AB7P40_00010 [Chloroflexota bacterium]
MARKRTPTERAPETTMANVPPAKPLVGGRLSRDADNALSFGGRLSAIIPPASIDQTWRTLDLDAYTLSRISPFTLAEYLADISPELSRALWDFLRECNAGHEILALRPGSEDIDTRAQDALDAFLTRLGTLYGTVDVTINRLFLALFMRGAICSELVLDAAGRAPVDLVIVDPSIVRARRVPDPVRGTVFEYGQMQDGRWIAFDRPTISYIPLDPLPASPYGRPMIAPAIFTSLFLIGLLHDLRRVIAQQGYPRYDIEIVLDEALKQMPPEAAGNPAVQELWLNGLVTSIANYYADLEPDSAFTHTSAVKLNRPISAVDTDSLGGIAPIIQALERMATRSLKTMPFMLGISESTTETQANRQAEQRAITIRAVQHLVENQLGHLLTLALQAQGIVADVQVRFAENRAAEEQRDEMVRQLKIANAGEGYKAGHLSQDEAAMYAWDKETADQPEPRAGDGPAAPDPASMENPDPSTSRGVRTLNGQRAPKLIPLGADDGFEPLGVLEPLMDDERAGLATLFDRTMTGKNGRYRGLLTAEVVDGEEQE